MWLHSFSVLLAEPRFSCFCEFLSAVIEHENLGFCQQLFQLTLQISQGLRPLPPEPRHDVMVSACCHVRGCWLAWLFEFVLSRWSQDVRSQSLLVFPKRKMACVFRPHPCHLGGLMPFESWKDVQVPFWQPGPGGTLGTPKLYFH